MNVKEVIEHGVSDPQIMSGCGALTGCAIGFMHMVILSAMIISYFIYVVISSW